MYYGDSLAKLKPQFTIDFDPFQEAKKIMKQRTVEIIGDAEENLLEYCKFTSGKNDLQSWIEANRTLKGRDFSYTNADIEMMYAKADKRITKAPRPYLIQYINDTTKDKTIIKCRQSEFTENEINENIWLAATVDHCNIRQIFPTGKMALKMAKEKISHAVEDSPKIAKLVKKPYSHQSKEFFNGSFYTVDSSWTDHGGRGPSSDKITFDEYESQNPKIEEIYSESTSHSKIGRRTRISTPLFPNSGIDLKFIQGCQYEWHIKCPKCKRVQIMEFPDNLINFFEANEDDINDPEYMKRLNKVYIGCKFCGEYVDRTSKQYLNTARWVAAKKHLVGMKASYRVTYMMLAWKTGKEILFKYHSFRFVHQFWNEVMGYAYIDPESRVSRGIFEQCIDNAYKNVYRSIGMARNVSVGIDWGLISWVVVRANGFPPNRKIGRVIYVEKINTLSLRKNGYSEAKQTDHVKRAEDIIKFFKAKITVNDANGIGVDRNSHLIKKFPAKAYGVFYDTEEIQRQKRKQRIIEPQWTRKSNRVTVSRVGTLKLLIQEYDSRDMSIPQLDPDVEEFIQHHTNIAIQMMQDENGNLYEIVGKTGPDHYAHADNYAKIGFDKIVKTERESVAGVITKPRERKAPSVNINDYVNPDLM